MISFDLEKSTEALQFSLVKHNVGTILPCQVNFTMDVSGSFDDEHRNGYTQQLLNRFVPFAMLFDKDKTLGSYVFASRCEQLGDINERNYADYIRKSVQRSSVYNGGTNYVPIFDLLIENTKAEIEAPVSTGGFLSRLFGRSKPAETATTTPEKHLHIFVTDGEAFDQDEAARHLDDLLNQHTNIYFLFVSISPRPMRFLQEHYGDKAFSSYINMTPQELKNLQNTSDEALYDLVLTDSMTAWMNRT